MLLLLLLTVKIMRVVQWKPQKPLQKKGIQVSVLGVGMPDGAPIPVEGTNDYRRDREGNVIVTRLNEAMCQEIC